MIELTSVPLSKVKTLLDRDHNCVICGESDKKSLVFHPVVPFDNPSVDSDLFIDSHVVLCRSCAHKIENSADTLYSNILNSEIWSKPPHLSNLEDKPLFVGLLTKTRRMSHINRFAPEIFMRPENVAEHSYWVTQLSLAIAKEYVKSDSVDKMKLIMMALFHDMPEIITTDVPTPIKRASKETDAYFESVEDKACLQLEKMLGQEQLSELIQELNHGKTTEAMIVRASDRVAAICYACEEAMLGNRNFFIVIRRMYESLLKNVSPSGNFNGQPEWLLELYSDITNWLSDIVSPTVLKGEDRNEIR